MGFKMYHNGKTFCCIHDNGDSYFAIYNSKRPHDDADTKCRTIVKPRFGAKDDYLKYFLKKYDYQEIEWPGAS